MLILRKLKSLKMTRFSQSTFRVRGKFYLQTNSTSPYALGVTSL